MYVSIAGCNAGIYECIMSLKNQLLLNSVESTYMEHGSSQSNAKTLQKSDQKFLGIRLADHHEEVILRAVATYHSLSFKM